MRGLRPGDNTRPGDVTWLDNDGDGRHLIVDVDDNTRLATLPSTRRTTSSRNDRNSSHPVNRHEGGRHRFVPFAVETGGGRFGEHALALLLHIAEKGVRTGHPKAPPQWRDPEPKAIARHRPFAWLQDLSWIS